MQSNILCLETSAAKCSVALTDGINRTFYRESVGDYSHVSQITTLIEDILGEAGLDFQSVDAVAISDGPGSYTGLRVGASTAKGICFGADIPLISLSTLESIAGKLISMYQTGNNNCYISVIDARRDEVYMAGFDEELNEIIAPQAYILTEESFRKEQLKYDKVIIGGNAATKSKEILKNPDLDYHQIIPDAHLLIPGAKKAFIGNKFAELSSYKPFYLKPPNITVSKKQFFRKN